MAKLVRQSILLSDLSWTNPYSCLCIVNTKLEEINIITVLTEGKESDSCSGKVYNQSNPFSFCSEQKYARSLEMEILKHVAFH